MVDRVWPVAAVVSIITPKVERLARKRGSPVVKRGFRKSGPVAGPDSGHTLAESRRRTGASSVLGKRVPETDGDINS